MHPATNHRVLLPDPEFFIQLTQNFAGVLAASIGVLALKHSGAAIWSLLIGAAVSAANFWLLSHSIPKLLRPDPADAPLSETGRVVRRALLEFVGRYVILGGVAYLAVRNHSVNLMGFAWGLSLPVFAIMVQGIRMAFSVQRVKSASSGLPAD
ncbi:MAG: ATP synthase subunit I [Acidobacteriia bacterium]|nr:ATP synthase subunit I [Terriglobia bacterium]